MDRATTTHLFPDLRKLRPVRLIMNFFIARDAAFRQRRALERLEPHLLRDIGLTDRQVSDEVAKPFWDAPVLFKKR